MGMDVGSGVGVGAGVFVGLGVGVDVEGAVGSGVLVGVGVCVAVGVAVLVGMGVIVGAGVVVGRGVRVGVGIGVLVGEGGVADSGNGVAVRDWRGGALSSSPKPWVNGVNSVLEDSSGSSLEIQHPVESVARRRDAPNHTIGTRYCESAALVRSPNSKLPCPSP